MPPVDLQSAGPPVFAPVVFRLAMKTEQVTFGEFAEDPTEAVYVLRAARKLFGLDLSVCWFDTWLEAEAAGATIARDPLGLVVRAPQKPAALPAVADVLKAAPVRQAIEIVRRLSLEQQAVAGMLTGAATLRHRLNSGGSDSLEYAAELAVALGRAYCEAGAAALLLVEEEASPDLAELETFTSLVNLARYYGMPVILLGGQPLSPRGIEAANAITGGLFVTPTQAGSAVRPLPDNGHPAPARARLALSRWEIDAETPPETLLAWRHALAA